MLRCDNYLSLIFTLVSKFAGYQAYIKIEKLSVYTVFFQYYATCGCEFRTFIFPFAE